MAGRPETMMALELRARRLARELEDFAMAAGYPPEDIEQVGKVAQRLRDEAENIRGRIEGGP